MFSMEKICDFSLNFTNFSYSIRNIQNVLNVSPLSYFGSSWFSVMLQLNLFEQVKREHSRFD